MERKWNDNRTKMKQCKMWTLPSSNDHSTKMEHNLFIDTYCTWDPRLLANVAMFPVYVVNTFKVWNQQVANCNLFIFLFFFLILFYLSKNLFHHNLVLTVDNTKIRLAQMNCAYSVASSTTTQRSQTCQGLKNLRSETSM